MGLFSSLLLDWLLPSQTPTQKKNMVQLTDSESQTTTHTSKKKNTVQLTDSEFQITTTKKDTARDTTTQDATEEDATEEDRASGDAVEVVTAEGVTLKDAESSTVNKVEHQERTTFEYFFIYVCSFLAVNKN